MSKRTQYASAEIDVATGTKPARLLPGSDTPFRILIMGDFSGRANRGICESGRNLAARRPILIDRDNFDEVLSRIAPALNLPGAGLIRFARLDDFHPDLLLERLDLFRRVSTSPPPASGERGAAASAARQPAPPPADIPDLLSGGLLEQMMEDAETGKGGGSTGRSSDPLAEYIRRIVEPHLVPNPDPAEAASAVRGNQAIGAIMRDLLHHSDFQALEAAWRALNFLVRRLETGPDLKVYLLDVSKAELAGDLRPARDLKTTGLYRLWVEQAPGSEPWAVLAGGFTFGPTLEDVDLLGRIGLLADECGAPFLAAGDSQILGCESLASAPDPSEWRSEPETDAMWDVIRRMSESAYIGLALPGFLLRLPYGKETDKAERFDFEELPGEKRHGDYLWGNPAFACALLLGKAFLMDGWKLRPGSVQDIGGLPLHVFPENGQSVTTPCAEANLTYHAAEKILDKGLMPLLSMKDADVVKLARFQSLQDPPSALAGRWTGR